MTEIKNLDRREFLKTSSATAVGLVVGFYLPKSFAKVATTSESFKANAFIILRPDNSVTVIAKHLEMGQGVYTGLATIVAEEMDLDWAQVQVESAPADVTKYNNLAFGPMQGTGGSSSIFNSWKQLREAGASARSRLVLAASEKWKVPASEIQTDKGVLSHKASGKSATYGEFAIEAQAIAAPKEVKLKSTKDFKYIGKSVRRKDVEGKVNGQAKFAMDMHLPNKVYAVVSRPPQFGAKVKKVNDADAKKQKGVIEVLTIPQGVVVIAEHFWQAKTARDLLEIEWDNSSAIKKSSSEIKNDFEKLLKSPGAVASSKGSISAGQEAAVKKVVAQYEFPYLAHAPMETLNCVVHFKGGKATIWSGDQFQTNDQAVAAIVLGIDKSKVEIKTMFAGGSFGRRANFKSDYIAEAATIAKMTKKAAGRPIHTIWTREDDIRGGYYRPSYLHSVEAGVKKDGQIAFWQHRIAGQSIAAGTVMDNGGLDHLSVEGVSNLAYKTENLQVELHSPKLEIPVLWWRSVGHTHTAFVAETMIDELAVLAKEDPVRYRLKNLSADSRYLGVLKLVAEKSGWGRSMPKGTGLGIAVHESFRSFVAQVAQVKVVGGEIKVEKVWCAVDCGTAVNPDIVRAQMEGGIGFALSAALFGEITFEKGLVEQSNFHNYVNLRIKDMPDVEVHIVPSSADPTGVGEPGVPPLAPAVANAVFAATGTRLRKLPFKLG